MDAPLRHHRIHFEIEKRFQSSLQFRHTFLSKETQKLNFPMRRSLSKNFPNAHITVLRCCRLFAFEIFINGNKFN